MPPCFEDWNSADPLMSDAAFKEQRDRFFSLGGSLKKEKYSKRARTRESERAPERQRDRDRRGQELPQ